MVLFASNFFLCKLFISAAYFLLLINPCFLMDCIVWWLLLSLVCEILSFYLLNISLECSASHFSWLIIELRELI